MILHRRKSRWKKCTTERFSFLRKFALFDIRREVNVSVGASRHARCPGDEVLFDLDLRQLAVVRLLHAPSSIHSVHKEATREPRGADSKEKGDALGLQLEHPLLPEPAEVKVLVQLCLQLLQQRVRVVRVAVDGSWFPVDRGGGGARSVCGRYRSAEPAPACPERALTLVSSSSLRGAWVCLIKEDRARFVLMPFPRWLRESCWRRERSS